MRLAVIGSRSFNNYALLKSEVAKLNPWCIFSGGAKGADTLAVRYAIQHNVECVEFLPDYNQHGAAATHVRNRLIVDAVQVVLAFWDGKSKGTLSTIEYARKQGKRVICIYFSNSRSSFTQTAMCS